jgi:hypothetical protein
MRIAGLLTSGVIFMLKMDLPWNFDITIQACLKICGSAATCTVIWWHVDNMQVVPGIMTPVETTR